MMFVYIDEFGCIAASKNKPTATDLASAEDGCLDVLKVDGDVYQYNCKLQVFGDLDEAKLVDCEPGQKCHVCG